MYWTAQKKNISLIYWLDSAGRECSKPDSFYTCISDFSLSRVCGYPLVHCLWAWEWHLALWFRVGSEKMLQSYSWEQAQKASENSWLSPSKMPVMSARSLSSKWCEDVWRWACGRGKVEGGLSGLDSPQIYT